MPATGVREHCARKAFLVSQPAGDRGRLEKGLAEGGIAKVALGLADADQQRAALGRVAGCGPEELERLVEPAQRLVRCELLECTLAGLRRIPDCLAGVHRRRRERPVVRELGKPLAGIVIAECLERLRNAVVHARAACRAQTLVERVVDQGVSEVEPSDAVGGLEDDRCLEGLVERVDQLVLVELHQLGEQLRVERAADHGRDRQDLAQLLIEPAGALTNPQRSAAAENSGDDRHSGKRSGPHRLTVFAGVASATGTALESSFNADFAVLADVTPQIKPHLTVRRENERADGVG